jgi:hypothetical protein
MDSPFTLPKNVAEGCLIKSLFRSMEMSIKSLAGEGKPALMPNETKGRSNVELGSIENRSKAAPDFSKRPGIIENN